MRTDSGEPGSIGYDGGDDDRHMRRLVVSGGEVGYHDSAPSESILLVHAGVFSDWFLPLGHHLPRERFRVVRMRRCGYRGTAPPAGHVSLADAELITSFIDSLPAIAVSPGRR